MEIVNFRGLRVVAGKGAALQYSDRQTGEVLFDRPLEPGFHDLAPMQYQKRPETISLVGEVAIVSGQPETGPGELTHDERGETAAVQEFIPSATWQQRALVMQVADEMARRATVQRDRRARVQAQQRISVPEPDQVRVAEPDQEIEAEAGAPGEEEAEGTSA